ncbi:hypothetical protein SERLADRAFT_432028 [Serpula lacrymans var. lacrymans S7.9]|uniref:Uncharacterized protein n=1 Tax=Serpula lacrymans var. lacrymans (strain S7.9) TaxID=578457 RepID=F8NE88_SERL9|nr:uncharacterized protein SERLADRAFT_432028 [Serpula lacrymans var. lacrymans S7.9]EGO30470.1 hypothetical protein SERLADRAFT_432028 [Serpula lacrymans var. lacrymans S7.9]
MTRTYDLQPLTPSQAQAVYTLIPTGINSDMIPNIGGSSSLSCSCGRLFSQPNALSNHKRNCPKTRKCLGDALEKAKELWIRRKQQQTGASCSQSTAPAETSCNDDPDVEEQLRMPEVPLPAVPPSTIDATYGLESPHAPALSLSSHAQVSPEDRPAYFIVKCLRFLLRTSHNIFGLFRQYHGNKFPTHNPKEDPTPDNSPDSNDTLHCLSNDTPTQSSNSDFFMPYPNYNAFRLGEWYWDGAQKLKESFKELLDIVGDPNFCSEKICEVNWNLVDRRLAGDDVEEWLDDDAGWTKTTVRISVPFHKKTSNPGSKQFVHADFYHQNLVSII